MGTRSRHAECAVHGGGFKIEDHEALEKVMQE